MNTKYITSETGSLIWNHREGNWENVPDNLSADTFATDRHLCDGGPFMVIAAQVNAEALCINIGTRVYVSTKR